MGSRKQSKKVYGESAHYWPAGMQMIMLAAACIDVVSENSERAQSIYREVVEAWGRPSCQQVLGEVNLPLKDVLALALGNEEATQLPDELVELYERNTTHPDCQYLINRIDLDYSGLAIILHKWPELLKYLLSPVLGEAAELVK